MLKALINVRIYDYEKYIENGFIIYDENILEVGDMKDFHNHFYWIIDGHGKLVLPNFVCAHSHIYSIFARGLSLPFNPKNFQEILDQMWWKIDRQIDNKITYSSGIAAGCEFLLNGVTTIIDHHASGTEILGSLEALNKALNKKIGLKSILCFETSDRFDVDECIKENLKNAKNHNGLFGMHASMSLSDSTLDKIKLRFENTPIHVHVAESEMDEIDCKNKYNMTIMERLNHFNLVVPDSLVVHGVHISDKELDIVKNNKAYMVINPTSNLNNAVGIPDIKNYLNKGIKVMVGNDGLSSSMATEYLNAYYLTHLKNNEPIAMNLGDIIDIINNAYEYVEKRLGVKIGKIKPGFVSDFMTVEYIPFTEMNESNAFGHIFFGLFPNFKPLDVFVDGKHLVKYGKLNSSKLKKELSNASKASEELWKRVKE